MNGTISSSSDESRDTGLDRRIMRMFLSVTAFMLFLTGLLTGPVWTFSLSVISVYFAMTAIIGIGAFGGLAGSGSPAEVVAMPRGHAAAGRGGVKRAA